MPLLPPPSNPAVPLDPAVATALVTYSDNLIRQAQSSPATAMQFDEAEDNYNLYLGNHGGSPAGVDAYRYVYNRIKTIVVSHAAVQSGEKKITFLPRQSGRKGSCFINPTVLANLLPLAQVNADLAALLKMIPAECMVAPPDRPAPLPRAVYETLDAAVKQGQMLVQQAMVAQVPPPKVIPPELIVEVNDTTAAKALQTLFDAKWEECDANLIMLLEEMQNGIIGWQHLFYRWDRHTENHELHLCEFRQVFLDPTRPDISKSATAVFGLVLSEEEASAKFPEFAKQIDDGFTIGKPSYAGIAYQRADIYESTNFLQKYGEIRFTWIRNQPYPMSPEEALARGLVVRGFPYQSPVPPTQPTPPVTEDSDAQPNSPPPPPPGQTPDPDAVDDADRSAPEPGGAGGAGEPTADAGDDAALPAESPGAGDAVPATEGGPVDVHRKTGTMAAAPGPGLIAGDIAPTAYLLVVNGRPAHEVKPWGPGWPMRRGIRELVMIAGDCVADREYVGANIPLTHNVNYPLFYGPLGQGTPKDLKDLNLAINSLISDLVALMRQQAFRTNIVSKSLEADNPEISKRMFRRPGTTLTAPDNLMMDLQKHIQSIEPGNASTDIWQFLGQLLDLIDKQGDMASVLQGQTNAGMSGKLFADANAAAQTAILFRSRRQELMLIYLTKLMLGGLFRMSSEGLAEAIPGTPIFVWDALRDWWRSGQFQLDISAEVAAGGGAARQQRSQNLVLAAQTGAVKISQATLQEAMDLDPEKEKQQLREDQAEMQPAAPEGNAGQEPQGKSAQPPKK